MSVREEVEELKRHWKKDPCWDIEDTEGFEQYREELKAFSEEQHKIWEAQAHKYHKELASKICPLMTKLTTSNKLIYSYCKVEKCAWWDDFSECCSMANGMMI